MTLNVNYYIYCIDGNSTQSNSISKISQVWQLTLLYVSTILITNTNTYAMYY